MRYSKNAMVLFKNKPFQIEEFCEKSGLKQSSARNLLSELMKNEMLEINLDSDDKRRRYYKLNWKYIVKKLKNPDEDYNDIVSALHLEEFEGKHVLLKDFEVQDSNINLMELVEKYWDKTPSEEYVIITCGIPKDELTIESESL